MIRYQYRNISTAEKVIIHQHICQNIVYIDDTGVGDCYHGTFVAYLAASNNGAREDEIKICMKTSSAAGVLITVQ